MTVCVAISYRQSWHHKDSQFSVLFGAFLWWYPFCRFLLRHKTRSRQQKEKWVDAASYFTDLRSEVCFRWHKRNTKVRRKKGRTGSEKNIIKDKNDIHIQQPFVVFLTESAVIVIMKTDERITVRLYIEENAPTRVRGWFPAHDPRYVTLWELLCIWILPKQACDYIYIKHKHII